MKSISTTSICRWLAIAVLVSGLVACASAPKQEIVKDYSMLLDTAEADVSAGRIEPALIGFNEAAKADPTRKEPWVRSAQLQFDAGNYGRAIVAAEEVLRRDPNDRVADSVLTISGLRVAAQSLQRLQTNGTLASETARKEAQQLAATMRATMGTVVFVSEDPEPVEPTPKATPKARPKTPVPAKPSEKPPENPFDILDDG